MKKVAKKISVIHKQLILLGHCSTKINWKSNYQIKKQIIICFDGLFLMEVW